jgi:predicted membrane-bound spermidine synthase
MPTVSIRAAYLIVFAVSGFSGLIYESIWSHYLKLFLGHAAYAQTLVLAIFMGGLAAGSWLSSRYSARLTSPLRAYAVAEALVGLCALVFHWIFVVSTDLAYSSLIPALQSPAGATAVKWGLATLLILPQSVILGTTFPFMTAGVVRLFPDQPGRTIALLYFANSIGGAMGVLASGFVLIKLVGLPGAMAIAGVINLCVAFTVAAMAPRMATAALVGRIDEPAARDRSWFVWLLAVAFGTGAASFIYEIGWIRMLSLVLGSSTHSFEVMLSAFILGLAFGGLYIRRRIDTIEHPVRYLAFVQVLMGLSALATLIVYGETFQVMRWLMRVLPRTDAGYALFNLGSHGIAMAVMVPTTFLAGMTLPLITLVLLRGRHGEASVGAVYGANTLGAIAGVFAAVHVGFPLLGLKGLIIAGGSLDIVIGLCLLWFVRNVTDSLEQIAAVTASVAAVAGCVFLVQLDPQQLASGVYRPSGQLAPGGVVIRHEDGTTASIDLIENDDGVVSIRTNGKTDASLLVVPTGTWASDEPTMVLTAAIPLALMPSARSVANIGFGSGLTTHVLLSSRRLERVDSIEIEPMMVELARGFAPRNSLAYSDPRSRIVLDDAKSFFSTERRFYDVIVSEPSNPWVSGVAGLFSQEFYRQVKGHLTSAGLLVQWLQLYEIDVPLVFSVLKALGSEFDDYALYSTAGHDLLVVASRHGPVPPLSDAVFEEAGVRAELRRVGVLNPQDITVRRLGSRRFWDPLVQRIPVPPNSDFYPVLDQGAARTRFLERNATELLSTAWAPLPVLEMLDPAHGRVLAEETTVTPVPWVGGSARAFVGMSLRNRVRGLSYPNDLSKTTEDLRLQVETLLNRCTTARRHDRVDVIIDLAGALSAALLPVEVSDVWSRLGDLECVRMLDERDRAWLMLAEDVGARNAAGMTGLGEQLAQRESASRPARQFALTAAMLGHLALGRQTEAGRTWERYGPSLFGDRVSLLIALLRAHATKVSAHDDNGSGIYSF